MPASHPEDAAVATTRQTCKSTHMLLMQAPVSTQSCGTNKADPSGVKPCLESRDPTGELGSESESGSAHAAQGDKALILVDMKSHGRGRVCVTIDKNARLEQLHETLGEILNLPANRRISLALQGSDLPVDDFSCVRDLGLTMFATLTGKAPCLSGGMLSKNRDDGSESDAKSHEVDAAGQDANPLPSPPAQVVAP